MHFSRFLLAAAVCGILLAASGTAATRASLSLIWLTSAPPSIDRVEPPGWWAGHSLNPIRLLLSGQNLKGVTAWTEAHGVRIADVTETPSGSRIFLSLQFEPGIATGPVTIHVQAKGGTTTASFDVLPPLERSERFLGFSPDDVIYLLMPDRFCDGDPSNDDPPVSRGLYSRSNARGYHGGDFQGVIDHLPYLKDLGITAIWMTPVYDNANRPHDYWYAKGVTSYHGYGATDFYRTDEHFGSLEKFRELVDRAHALGLKVIQDQVLNHTGPDHAWVNDPPTPSWINGTLEDHLDNPFDIPSLTDRQGNASRANATLRGWFANVLPDINQDDQEAARYEIQNSLWWIGVTGIDGIRLDTFPYVPRSFWARWNQAIQREYPRLAAVGEVFDRRPEVTAFFQGGREQFDHIDTHLYSVFDFASYFAMRDVFLRGQPMTELAAVIEQDRRYPDPSALITFLGNHDVPRFMHEVGAGPQKLRLALVCLLTMRGIPQIYYGDEIGMTGGEDPDNRRDFPGGFPGDTRDAFSAGGRTREEGGTFVFVRRLLRLRSAHAALRRGRMEILSCTRDSLAFLREYGGERAIVALNNSDRSIRLTVAVPPRASLSDERSGASVWYAPMAGGWPVKLSKGTMTLFLKPRDSLILLERKQHT